MSEKRSRYPGQVTEVCQGMSQAFLKA